MRPLLNAIAAGVALAFAAAPALAATTTATATPSAMPSIAVGNGSTGTFVNNSPRTAAPAAAPGSGTTTTTTTRAPNPANVSTVDLRNQQTLAATAGTHASGSTSAIDNLLAQGVSSAGESGNTTTTGNTVGNAPLVAGYVFGNPSDVTALPYASQAPVNVAANTALASDVYVGSAVSANDAAHADVNVNRAIAQVQRDRNRIGRNGQLLYSIAPRTNVDRSAEMPDDGPPPSLTGSNSTLTR